MTLWSRLRSWFGAILRRSRMESEMDAELRFHIETYAEDLIRSGVPSQEALRRARLEFGGAERVKEECREARGVVFLESLLQDLRFGLRALWKSPGFTAVAVLTLALGIGVNTSIFTLLNALILRPLAVPEAHRVVTLFRGDSRACSYPDYLDYRDRNRAFSDLAADMPNETSLDAGDSSEVILVEGVSYNYANVLETKPLLGRWFSPGDERVAPGEFLAVISYRIWRSRFAGDPNVLGKQVRMESRPYTIIGVAAQEFQGMSQPVVTDLWVPLAAYARHNDFIAGVIHNRLDARIMLVGRLAPGVTEARAQAEMNVIDGHLQSEYPRPKSRSESLRTQVAGGVSDPAYRHSASQLMTLLMAVVAMVLLIACANIANLLLVRGIGRRHEMAIRLAVGAGRFRIVQQTMIESMWLALLGAALGVVAANWTNGFLEASIARAPSPITVSASLNMDGRVLAFVLCAAVLTTLVFGMVPAIQASRPDLVLALKGDQTAGRRHRRWLSLRNLYVIAQVTISLMLLIVSGLFIRALGNAGRIDPGFDPRPVLSMRLYVAKSEFTEPAARDLYHRALDRVRALPGVQNATLSYTSAFISASECVAAPNPGGDVRALMAGSNIVAANYFATLGIPRLAGRDFTRADGADVPAVVIVNDVLARKYFPGQDPIGRRLRVGRGCDQGRGSDAEVIGVAKDARYAALDRPPQPFVFFPFTQRFAGYVAILVRTHGDPAIPAPAIRKELLDLDHRLRIYEVTTLSDQKDKSLWLVRSEATMLGAFGVLALLLAAVGLYGVIASAARQRTKEFGIRMALGARRRDVLRLVLANALMLTAVGVALGLAGSLAFTRLLRGFLYGLSPTDTVTFAAAALLWIAVALVASYVPARRGTRVDPTVALRYE
jgi:predicted permease